MKILIVAKLSAYEFERERFGLSHEDVVRKYTQERKDIDEILKSHERQLKAREHIKELMPDADFMILNIKTVQMSLLDEKIKENYDLVISFGGDDSFTYVSHYTKGIPLAGVNSDPLKSVGALDSWSSKNLEKFVEDIEKKKV